MPKPYFDIVAIVPLQEEWEQLAKVFEFVADHSENSELRVEMRLPDSSLSLVCTLQDDMGKSAASNACTRMLRWCDTGLVVCIGIAGGISTDLRLGDVAYAGSILDVYDNSKTLDKDNDNIEIQLSPRPFDTSREIAVICQFVKAIPSLRRTLEAFYTSTDSIRKNSGINEYTARGGKRERLGQARFMPGCIICGTVSKSVIYNKQLQALDRRILAIETESGGVFDVSGVFDTDALCIRGISDYADGDKAKLEEETGGKIREIAAFTAFSFLALQMRSEPFKAILLKRRGLKTGSSSQIDTSDPANSVREIVLRISKYLDGYLRTLSPLYSAQPTGFRLPAPRVMLRRGTPELKKTPIEIKSFLQSRDRLVIALPKMYPDPGLPCVIAQDILESIVDDKQPIPLLIDAKTFSPPQRLLALSPEKVDNLAGLDGIVPTLIIANPPIGSRQKQSAFVTALNELGGMKIIVVLSERDLPGIANQFSDSIGAAGITRASLISRDGFFPSTKFWSSLDGVRSNSSSFK